jgi:large subunit ribosomal protein L5
MSKLKDKFNKEVIPAMREKFGHKNIMSVPKIEKVVINTGFGRTITGKTKSEQGKTYQGILDDLALITGQKPVLTKAKKSIAAFKLRQGTPVGAAVVLRKEKMYDFLEKLIKIILPRSRDFRGIDPKSFDKQGNLTIAIKEHIVCPEILSEKAKDIFGFEITITTTAKTKEQGLELLKLIGFPIKHGKEVSDSKIK